MEPAPVIVKYPQPALGMLSAYNRMRYVKQEEKGQSDDGYQAKKGV